MGLLQKLKSVLGLGSREPDSRPDDGRDIGVTVERERDETDADLEDAAAAGTDASSSTSAMTNVPDEPEQAAEPAEAAGPTDPDPDDSAVGSAEVGTLDETVDMGDEVDGDSDVGDAESEADDEEDTDAGDVEDAADEDEEADAGDEEEPADEDEEADADAESDGEDDTDTETASSDGEDESDETSDDSSEEQSEPVNVIKGIGPAYADRLEGAGVETVADLAAANAESLSEETDISVKRLQGWIDRASVR